MGHFYSHNQKDTFMKKLFLLLTLASSVCFAMEEERKTSKICYEPHEKPDSENGFIRFKNQGILWVEYTRNKQGIKKGSVIICNHPNPEYSFRPIAYFNGQNNPITKIIVESNDLTQIKKEDFPELHAIEELTINAPSLEFFDPTIATYLERIQSIRFEAHSLSESQILGLKQAFGRKLITAGN